jgi:hypothetical protein
VQLIAAELERRSQARTSAQQTRERLAREAGLHAGCNEVLELERLRTRVAALETQREQWQQKSQDAKGTTPRRIRLLHWGKQD